MGGQRISKDDIDAAWNDYQDGASYEQLTRRLGCSESQLARRFKPLGLRGQMGTHRHGDEWVVSEDDPFGPYMKSLLELREDTHNA